MNTVTITITEEPDGMASVSCVFGPDGVNRQSYAHALGCVAMMAIKKQSEDDKADEAEETDADGDLF